VPALIDHTIVGQSATTLTIRKDRNLGACRLCGAIFQPRFFIESPYVSYDSTDMKHLQAIYDAECEIIDWRRLHNQKHTAQEHLALRELGLTMMPEAAHRLAPYGLVPVDPEQNAEVKQALYEAPRAPLEDVDTTLKGWV